MTILTGRLCAAAAVALVTLSAAPRAGAQRFVGIDGGIYRVSGDTIWIARDTTVTRVVYHGDTVIKTLTVNDRPYQKQTYLMLDDSARILDARDAAGASRMPKQRIVPLTVATMERQEVEMELRAGETRANAAQAGDDWFNPPSMPDIPRTYTPAPNVLLVQHRDTVRSIRGCASLGKTDTAIFVLFGADSARRVSAPQRSFGEAMATSLIGQMRVAIIKARTAELQTDAGAMPPAPRTVCPPLR